MNLPNPVLTGLECRSERLSGTKLIDDYYAGEPGLGEFYAGYPWSLAAFQRRAERLRRVFTGERLHALKNAVEPSSPGAERKLERIASGEGFVITTGQQAGLFGGPLYTVYKILTAVRLADKLERALGVPVAPLFWIPADDHDWDEINHVAVIDPQNQLVTIKVEGPSEPPLSMARRPWGEGVNSALATLERVTAEERLLERAARPFAQALPSRSDRRRLVPRMGAADVRAVRSAGHIVQ